MVRLGDVCDVTSKNVNLKGNELIDYIDIASVDNMKKKVTGYTTICFKEAPSRARKIVVCNDIIISTVRPNLNAVAKIDFDTPNTTVVSTGFCVLRVKEEVSVDFIFHFCKSKRFIDNLVENATGASYPAVSDKIIYDVNLPMLPLKKQIKIAKELNCLDEVIAQRKQQLQKLDELVKARFVEMFGDVVLNDKGWMKEQLGKHIDIITGFPFESEKYVDDGIKICGGLIITPYKIEWEKCKYWKSSVGFEDYLLAKDDIVIAMDRSWINDGFKIARIEKDNLPALLIQRTARIRAKDINQSYLFYCFKYGGFDMHCNITGSLVPHISTKDIVSFTIMLPPLELQNQFAEFILQVDKSKLSVQKSLDKLEILKKALMQKYFG